MMLFAYLFFGTIEVIRKIPFGCVIRGNICYTGCKEVVCFDAVDFKAELNVFIIHTIFEETWHHYTDIKILETSKL